LSKIFCIPDPASRVAAVVEKRNHKWWRLGRWDLSTGVYEGGAWFRGSLYPQRCDLSPSGRWFSYFTLNYGSDWAPSPTYNAISRLPWLKALAAWKESGTWSRGYHFVSDTDEWQIGEATVGDPAPCRKVCGMRLTDAAQFAVERRRGWRESAEIPPRNPADRWDQDREVVMEKPSPAGDGSRLSVGGKFQAHRDANDWPPGSSAYCLKQNGASAVLSAVQWADWTFDGHLAVATVDGSLRILDGVEIRVVHETRIGNDEPKPRPAPEWASEW